MASKRCEEAECVRRGQCRLSMRLVRTIFHKQDSHWITSPLLISADFWLVLWFKIVCFWFYRACKNSPKIKVYLKYITYKLLITKALLIMRVKVIFHGQNVLFKVWLTLKYASSDFSSVPPACKNPKLCRTTYKQKSAWATIFLALLGMK